MANATLQVELPKLFFSCGEVVKGKVVFTPKSDKVINGIHINFTGHEWCENGALADVPFQKRWILDGSTTVYGHKATLSRDGRPNYQNKNLTEASGVLIKSGSYVWPFSFQIPKNIPPSCEYRSGKVKIDYVVSAIVDIPWSRSVKTTQHLRIGIPYFLDPNRVPVPVKVEKSFLLHRSVEGSGAHRPHLLKLEGWVDKPVTYTGDKVKVSVRLDNNSGRHVHSIKCKLKQTWTYGSGFWEKFTVFKMKHKDSQFPLSQGSHSLEIPMIIPNLVQKPTVQNASLIRCVYHVTLKLSFRMGGDLRARIPIIVASTPPAIKAKEMAQFAKSPEKLSSKPKKKKAASETSSPAEKDNSIKPKPHSISTSNLLNWDEATPDQINSLKPLAPQYTAMQPLQPLPEELHLMGPSLNIDDYMMDIFPTESGVEEEQTSSVSNSNEGISDIFMQEINFNKYIGEMNQNVIELDTGIQWAAAGQLDQTMDAPPTLSSKAIQSDIESVNKSLNICLGNLGPAIEGNPPFMDVVKELAYNTTAITLASRMAALSVPDINIQQSILSIAKAIPITVQQTAIVAKEATEKGQLTDDEILRVLDEKVRHVKESMALLLKAIQKAHVRSADSVVTLTQCRERIDQALVNFTNPFGIYNENATLRDAEMAAQNFATSTNKFVIACHGSDKEIVAQAQQLVGASENFMNNIKGVSKQYPTLSQNILDSVKATVVANEKLIELAKTIVQREHGSPSISMEKNLNLNSTHILQQSSRVIGWVRELTAEIKRQEEIKEREINEEKFKQQQKEQIELQKQKQQMQMQQELVRQYELQKLEEQKRQQEAERMTVDSRTRQIQAHDQFSNFSKPTNIATSQTETTIPSVVSTGTATSSIVQPMPTTSTTTAVSLGVPQKPSFDWFQPSNSADDFDTIAQVELASAMKSINEATTRLRLMQSNCRKVESHAIKVPFSKVNGDNTKQSLKDSQEGLQFFEMDHTSEVYEATGSLASAVGHLIMCAQQAQSERVSGSLDPSSIYHVDSTFAQGLVSASKEVAMLVNTLVSATDNTRPIDENRVVAIARAIAGSTAQLVSAARAKGDPEGEGHKALMNAAKNVAGAVSDLVSKTNEVPHKNSDDDDDDDEEEEESNGLTANKVQELEAAVRIAKLEKELNAARNQLKNLRTTRYEPNSKPLS